MNAAWGRRPVRVALLAASVVLLAPRADAGVVLRVVADVRLPGPASRFDYASLDPTSGLLYLNHMNAGEVVVFDTRSRSVAAVLTGFPRCTGVLAVARLGRVFVSAAGAGEVVALDAKTGAAVARWPAPGFPDGIAYEPRSGRLFVSEESGRAVTAIDPVASKVLRRIPLGGEAGNTQADPIDGLVYTNDQTNGLLAVIDPRKLVVRARIPLGMTGNHGLALDPPRRLAFIAGEETDRLLVLDLGRAEVVARFPVGRGPDVLAFDPGTRRLFVAAEEGPLSVFRERDGSLVEEGEQRVGENAHVVAVDPATHLVYVPLRNVNGRPVLRIMDAVAPDGR